MHITVFLNCWDTLNETNWNPLDLDYHLLSTEEVFSSKPVNTFPLASHIFYILFQLTDRCHPNFVALTMSNKRKKHLFTVERKYLENSESLILTLCNAFWLCRHVGEVKWKWRTLIFQLPVYCTLYSCNRACYIKGFVYKINVKF